MAKSLNRVCLLGNLGQDPEIKFTGSGIQVANFSIATSRSWKDKDSDEWKEETDWHKVVMWRNEKLSEILHKGMKVYVEGRLQTRSWEDKEGNKRYMTEIVADNVILMATKEGNGSHEPSPKASNSKGRAPAAAAAPEYSDDDVPF